MNEARQVQLVAYPTGPVRPSDFRTVMVPVPRPGPGEVLVRNTWTSVDPGLRLRMRRTGPDGYFAGFPLNAPMDGIMAVGEVVASATPGFGVGDTVWHALGWRDYAVVEAGAPLLGGLGTLTRLDTCLAPAQSYLGPLGGMGLTAYAGLAASDLRDGDVVWVSAAAGAVGSLVAQLARERGHRVIGSTGSAEKVAYLLDDLGLDAAFDYTSGPVGELLRAAAPNGIDVYFDNVGGDHLEAALGALRRGGRITLCGSVSEYERDSVGPSNLFQATSKELILRGLRGSAHLNLLPSMQREVGGLLAEGRLRAPETVFEGLDRAPEALASVLSGGGAIGKTLVRVDAPVFALTGPIS